MYGYPSLLNGGGVDNVYGAPHAAPRRTPVWGGELALATLPLATTRKMKRILARKFPHSRTPYTVMQYIPCMLVYVYIALDVYGYALTLLDKAVDFCSLRPVLSRIGELIEL